MAEIVSRPATDAYRANWERIFGGRRITGKIECGTLGTLLISPDCPTNTIEIFDPKKFVGADINPR